MWSLKAWRRRRTLERNPVDPAHWAEVRKRLPILDGLEQHEEQHLRERAVLFLHDKHLTALPGLELGPVEHLLLAAQAQLPLLHLGDLDWYRGFHEIVLYPDDFISPQRHRDASGIEHEWDDARSGEAWRQGPVILAWPGVQAGGELDGHNLVIHELAHNMDMLNGDANGLPPLHADMRIDAYAAESPGEFFAVASEYFFSAPDLLHHAFPAVYRQLATFYRQDPLPRLQAALHALHAHAHHGHDHRAHQP